MVRNLLKVSVLILVLMEDALVHFQIKEATGGNKIVLILVLMEDALVRLALLLNSEIMKMS